MSVINSVLNKLDQRGAARPAGLAPPSAAPKKDAARWRLPLIVVGGGVAIAATAFAEWPAAFGIGAPAVAARPALIAPPTEPLPEPVKVAALAMADPSEAAAPTLLPVPLADKPRPVEPGPRAAPVVVAAISSAPSPRVALALPAAPPVPATTLPHIDKRVLDAPPSQRAAAAHRAAIELAQTGHVHSAKERLREALVAQPAHTPSRVLLALLEHDTGANDKAIALLRDGLSRQPGDAATALMLSRLLAAGGDGAQALAVLDEHQLADAPAQGLRAGLLTQAGDWRSALAAYESAARQEPTNPAWWFGLGITLDAQGDAPRARQAFARAQSIGLAQSDQAAYAEQRLRALD